MYLATRPPDRNPFAAWVTLDLVEAALRTDRRDDAYQELTPQELEIARLAAEGMSNKQIAERLFMSHLTVGIHLCRIFPKLGVTLRARLSSALPRSQEDWGSLSALARCPLAIAPPLARHRYAVALEQVCEELAD